jgi:hypothetical protein
VPRRPVKPFDPPPNTPGAPIAWTQVHADGSTTERTGIVSMLAPTVAGCATAWVSPDQPLSTDPYTVVAVVVLPRNRQKKIGWRRDDRGFLLPSAAYPDIDGPRALPTIPGGTAYSEDHELTETGGLGAAAAAHGRDVRRQKTER